MDEKQRAINCRWATSTLFVEAPYWFAAEDFPWVCVRDGTPRVLQTTDSCATCWRWEPSSQAEVLFRTAQEPAVARAKTSG
jgi:hypothetical protein